MTESPKKPNLPSPSRHSNSNHQLDATTPQQKQPHKNVENEDIVTIMVKKIDAFNMGLGEYKIRNLVEDTEKLGKELAKKKLKTNQIRKFLDAVNRFQVQQREKQIKKGKNFDFSTDSRDELHVLRYQLAYAAARQKKDQDPGPVEPLKKVLEAAIKQVLKLEDFNRFVQLIESIVAYHKAAGGKDQ